MNQLAPSEIRAASGVGERCSGPLVDACVHARARHAMSPPPPPPRGHSLGSTPSASSASRRPAAGRQPCFALNAFRRALPRSGRGQAGRGPGRLLGRWLAALALSAVASIPALAEHQALMVGVGDYAHDSVNDLPSIDLDVMLDAAQQLGFRGGYIRTLLDQQAALVGLATLFKQQNSCASPCILLAALFRVRPQGSADANRRLWPRPDTRDGGGNAPPAKLVG